MRMLALLALLLLLFGCAQQELPVGVYKPAKGVTTGDVRTGAYGSILGNLPIQNPVTYDIGFGEPVPWENNSPSGGVEFLVLENELIRANYDGTVKFIRSDRAWRTTHIDIDNGIINGRHYMTA
jgi:hypothetical protein